MARRLNNGDNHYEMYLESIAAEYGVIGVFYIR